ncbi:hypothetical protein HPB52_010583 [Rhipicephalus sanguineus]|uniref:Uncharacterized protein n=1 Tax=Rhipicephalus sanguineus TaxID=34632 RepID=A0A9D4PE64_RHISA|nr:hypothetical protein HPB52_010583 [Rhipicephalus sanguineus]
MIGSSTLSSTLLVAVITVAVTYATWYVFFISKGEQTHFRGLQFGNLAPLHPRGVPIVIVIIEELEEDKELTEKREEKQSMANKNMLVRFITFWMLSRFSHSNSEM